MALFVDLKGKTNVNPVVDPVTGNIQRTNTALEVSDGDVPAEKWLVDNRLPVLFKYGFAYGINEMVISKGLIVAVDPIRFQKDFETGKMHSVLTIANGGQNVKLAADGIHWEALTGKEATDYANLSETEKNALADKRPANIPIGVSYANVYKKYDDQFNGMAPSVITRKYIKLPLFSNKTKAYANPWGSAYGDIKPGDYVKSDENGRFVKWVEGVDKLEQRVGQVLSVRKDLVPEGAAVWATWALEDRMNSDYFNPEEKQTSTGEYPGYPYDKAYGYNDLTRMNPRTPVEYDLNKGIPGLTDGRNAVAETVANQVIEELPVGTFTSMQNRYMRTLDINVEGLQIAVKATYKDGTVVVTNYASVDTLTAANAVKIKAKNGQDLLDLGHIEFADAKAGLVVLAIDKPATLGTTDLVKVEVLAKYVKRGKAGVPTMLDWDGCIGEVRVLLQK